MSKVGDALLIHIPIYINEQRRVEIIYTIESKLIIIMRIFDDVLLSCRLIIDVNLIIAFARLYHCSKKFYNLAQLFLLLFYLYVYRLLRHYNICVFLRVVLAIVIEVL